MKKTILLIALLFCGFASYADYTGTVTTSTADLSYSTSRGYNVVSLNKGMYNTQVGAPQLPVKTLSFLIPIDQMVSSISITGTSSVAIAGSYTMFPVQPPRINDTLAFVNPDTSIYNYSTPYPSVLYKVSNDGYPMGYHVVTISFNPLQYSPTSHSLKLYTSINFTIVYAANTANVLVPNQQSIFSNNLAQSYIKGMVANPSDVGVVSGGSLGRPSPGIGTGTGGGIPNLKGMSPAILTNIPDYIIITRSDLIGDASHGFQKLANWKTQKGINTLIVTVDGTGGIYNNYQGYDNPEKIRNYLRDVYTNFGSTFVLIGGDVTDSIHGAPIIPARVAYTRTETQPNFHETDYYYATVHGTWNSNGNSIFGEDGNNGSLGNDFSGTNLNDMDQVFFVGRAPSKSLADATTFATKIMEYETLSATSNKSYVNNLSFWDNDCSSDPVYGCGNDGFDSWTSDDLNGLQTNSPILLPSPYTVNKLYYSSTPSLSTSTAVSSLNSQTHLIYHLDHSGFDGLGTTSAIAQAVRGGDFDALTNANYYSIIYTDGCNPNDFTKNSIGKHYLNNQHGGGVAFLANVDFGTSSEIFYFINNFMDMLYNTSAPVNGLDSYENGRYHIGSLNAWSTGGTIERLKNRNLLGDPEMMVWSNTPASMTITGQTYTGSQVTGYITLPSAATTIVTVTAWKGSELWSTQDYPISTTSPVSFSLPGIVNTSGNITITANAHNYLPNVSTVNVPSPISGAHIYMSAKTAIDNTTINSTNNNDGFPDAGETISLPITLANSGNVNSSANISAVLSYSWTTAQSQMLQNYSSLITITNPNSTFPVITSGGGTQVTSTPFTFTINKNAFDPNSTYATNPRLLNTYISFTLTVYDNGVFVSATPFSIEIGEPNIALGENSVFGTLANDGSTNQLSITLYNIGSSQATGLQATLSSTSSHINMTNIPPVIDYSDINGVSNSTNYASNASYPFTFKMVGANYNSDLFTLSVTNVHGKTWTFPNFYLTNLTANFTELSAGSLTSINLSWSCSLVPPTPSGDVIKGYNLYRRLTSAGPSGPYSKINPSLILYNSFVDDGQGNPLAQLTSYDYELTVVDVNGNESVPSALSGSIFSASTSLPIHTGWPVQPSLNQEIIGTNVDGSPNVYDIYDGTNGKQGNKQIFFTSGDQTNNFGGIWGFEHDGSRWYSFDGDVTDKNGIVNFSCASSATPFIADIDGDGIAELGATTRSGPAPNNNKAFVYKIQDIANQAPSMQPTGFPTSLGGLAGGDVAKGSMTSDLDKDGKMEVLGTDVGYGTNNGLKVFNQDGTIHTGWTTPSGNYCGYTMPVAFDFDDDRKKEIVIGCTGSNAGLYIYKQDGTPFSSNPISSTSGYRCDFPPIVADLNNDGAYEIIFMATTGATINFFAYCPHPITGSAGYLTGWDPAGSSWPHFTAATSTGNNTSMSQGQFGPGFSVGDLDKDGYPELVCGDGGSASSNAGTMYVWGHGGTSTPISTFNYSCQTLYTFYPPTTYKTPIIADVDNVPGDLEVLFVANSTSYLGGTNIFAFKATAGTATPVIGFPIYIPENTANSPCVDNIDECNNTISPLKNELIVTSTQNIYVWDSKGDASNNIYGWTSHRKDNYNSGVYFDMADGYLYDQDVYLQNQSNLGGTVSTNKNRYFFARNILIGSSVTGKVTPGAISINSTSNISVEATNTVLLQADVTIPIGCTFEIK